MGLEIRGQVAEQGWRSESVNNDAKNKPAVDLEFNAGKPKPARGWGRLLFIGCALALGILAPGCDESDDGPVREGVFLR